MRTAEEWTQQALKDTGELVNTPYYRQWAAEIQLDAMKEGMRRAAVMAEHWNGAVSIDNIILTAAEQLTEKDL